MTSKRDFAFGDGLFMVAEIGANHDGDPEKAHRLIDRMAEAGADAVKFQTYTPETLLADRDREVEWGPPGKKTREKAGELFRRVALPREAHAALFEHAREKGLEPFSTPFDPKDVPFLLDLGQRVFKISSGDVNYRQLLEAVARSGKPAILSCGKSTFDEVKRAVGVLRGGGAPLCVMHCVASYPSPVDEANLRVLDTFRREFPEAVLGFSDHTQGIACSTAAVALGARVIEKHVTYDSNAVGPDHWFSSEPSEFATLARDCRIAFQALGSDRKGITPSEQKGAKFGKRSIISRQDLPKGHRIEKSDLEYLRPGTGIDPFEVDRVIGRTCKGAVARGTPLTWDLLEP